MKIEIDYNELALSTGCEKMIPITSQLVPRTMTLPFVQDPETTLCTFTITREALEDIVRVLNMHSVRVFIS
jgi:hypothetical protein